MVGEYWSRFETYAEGWPLWAKLIVAMVVGYFGIRFAIKQALVPLADEIRQILYLIRTTIAGWFRKKEPVAPTLPQPSRVVPLERTIWESAEVKSRERPAAKSIPIITVANMKGGVGKTTSCVNIACSLAHLNRRILMIDLDPQGNATMGSGVNKKQLS